MYKKYRVAYLSFALTACLLIGFFMLLFSVTQLRSSAWTNERRRMELAANWLESQLDEMEDISYRIQIDAHHRPAYFERNSLSTQEMMSNLAKFQGYSPIIADVKLLYCKTPDYIYGVQYKTSFTVFAEETIGVPDAQSFRELLFSVTEQTIFFPAERTDIFCVARRLAINGNADPSGDAVLIFIVSMDDLLRCVGNMSGIDTDRLVGLTLGGVRLLSASTDGETLTVTRDACALTLRMPNMFDDSEILSLCLIGLSVVAAVLAVLAIAALLAAKRSYRPIGSFAERYGIAPNDELEQIDRMLTELKESNRTSQQEITRLLTQLKGQRRRLKSHILLLLLNDIGLEMSPEQMRDVGLDFGRELYCAVAIQITAGEAQNDEILQSIEALSDSAVMIYAIRVSGQGHFAAIVNTDDIHAALELKDMLRDVFSTMNLEAEICPGELVRESGKLHYSYQTALYGLYHGEMSDLSMLGDGAIQRLLELTESERSDEAKRLFGELMQTVASAYPAREMQRDVVYRIAEGLNAAARQHGLPDDLDALRHMLRIGAMDAFSARVNAMIDQISSAVGKAREEERRRDEALSKEVLAFIAENACDGQFSQEVVAERFGISERQVGRIVREATGVVYKEHIVNIKIEAAKALLLKGLSVTETCARIGYANIPHFIKKFKEKTGMTPGNWKENRTEKEALEKL